MVETSPQQKHQPIPPLESGDHLNRYEFERRYNAMPHLRKAELIEGFVYVPAALRFRSQSRMALTEGSSGDQFSIEN
jgi:hypothetical protein